MPWYTRFDEPIALPRGRQLVTLGDAGNYITKLPKAEHAAKEWQTAMEALILVATHGGPTMFAHRRHAGVGSQSSQVCVAYRAFCVACVFET
jgi:hypothetical protein